MTLDFAVWAPDEATFRQSWIDAGILLDQPGYTFSAEYPGIELSHSWGGIVTKPNPVEGLDPVTLPGWHCNVRVTGPLVAEMTYGLDQYDADGSLKWIFDRSWAVQIFQLTPVPLYTPVGYPAGYANTAGVRYADPRDFTSPSCIWA